MQIKNGDKMNIRKKNNNLEAKRTETRWARGYLTIPQKIKIFQMWFAPLFVCRPSHRLLRCPNYRLSFISLTLSQD